MVTTRILSKEEFEKISNKETISVFARIDSYEFVPEEDFVIFYKENTNESLVFKLLNKAKCSKQDSMFIKAREFDLYLRNPRELIDCDDSYYQSEFDDGFEYVEIEDLENHPLKDFKGDFCLFFERI